MSCHEWEEGTITLPASEAPRVRDAVKAAHAAHVARVYEHAQLFWKECPRAYKADVAKYRNAASRYCDGNLDGGPWRERDPKLPAWRGIPSNDRNGLHEDVTNLIGHAVLHHYETEHKSITYHDGTEHTFDQQNWCDNAPRRVTQADVVGLLGKATGATFTLMLGESTIRFEGRKVTWSVGQNNHARDYGREHPISQALFAALDRVSWTRGSGGTIVGNDEYNRDSTQEGGGGNYVITRYGPASTPRRSPRSAARLARR